MVNGRLVNSPQQYTDETCKDTRTKLSGMNLFAKPGRNRYSPLVSHHDGPVKLSSAGGRISP